MYMKELVFSLILLMQACGPLLAQATEPEQPDSTGLLQRLGDRARETKDKVQVFGGVVLDYFGAYYEDHIQPVADSYTEWASTVKSSVLEKIQTTIDKYWPSKASSSTD
ncbi:apolipoprotein C-IV [Micropterus dolomieu]|uniref:apolipoprotein C-IV n=1 Tax=Micropterus dolomieu TaxID=147949 RepID=UPI001E8E4EA6|nr:apolipoprotein C-IV [Micropterus dolomieu]